MKSSMKALTVRQPWAWLLIHGLKNIENRDWWCSYRGQLAIHAAKGMTRDEYYDALDLVQHISPQQAAAMPGPSELVRGAVIGTMRMTDCVRRSNSPWFSGKYGFVLDTPQPCDPVPCRGALGLWNWEFEAED